MTSCLEVREVSTTTRTFDLWFYDLSYFGGIRAAAGMRVIIRDPHYRRIMAFSLCRTASIIVVPLSHRRASMIRQTLACLVLASQRNLGFVFMRRLSQTPPRARMTILPPLDSCLAFHGTESPKRWESVRSEMYGDPASSRWILYNDATSL